MISNFLKAHTISLTIFVFVFLGPTSKVIAEDSSENESTLKETIEKVFDEKQPIHLGGALRINYSYKDWNEKSKDKSGDLDFDIFRLNLDGEVSNIILSAEYRWYEYMDVIHHGWLGYNLTDTLQGQLGISRVPFGLLPYASHNFWFGLPYYVGLEDDYDMGLKLLYGNGPLDIQAAFYKNDEYANSARMERYSFDLVTDGTDQFNEEQNQMNLRATYNINHDDLGSTEVGVSGQWGELYNTQTTESGDHWAAAAHLNGNYGNFNLQLEYARYEYDPENQSGGASEDSILMGAFAASYLVASEADVYVANISYGVPVSWGPISKLTFYNDYSLIKKEMAGWDDSQINTTGCMISAGALYTYVDFIAGKNAPWLGSNSDALTAATDDNWHTLFNVNFGFYF